MTSSPPSFPHPTPSSLLSINIQFGLSTSHSCTSIIGIQNPPILGNFWIFLENFNNEINIVTYGFFFANAQSIYYSHVYNKADTKANSFSPNRLLWKTNAQMKFQDGNSVIEK